jgi:predicted metal-dependent peptidase
MQSFDVILDPNATSQGKGKGTGQDQRSQTEWDTAIAGAMASAKLQGKLPAALEKMFGDMLEPEITWSDHIKSFFARKVGGGSYDWRKPDRRLIQRDIYAPARMGHGAGDVVVAIDTSGSIGQRELDVFFAELKGILTDVRPQRVHVVWCDAKVHKVDEVEDANDIDGLKPHGGGGTDFRPVFEWIDGNLSCPDALVYLTDGLGNFPDHTPDYPVLWGDIYGRVKFPFGDVVTVPIK